MTLGLREKIQLLVANGMCVWSKKPVKIYIDKMRKYLEIQI